MPRRFLVPAALVAALSLGSSPGRADGDERERSRAAFRRGVSQVEAGDYAGARDWFLEAYRLFPHPSILLNLGIARAHTGQWLEAEQDLVRFLADDGGAQSSELASARAELNRTRTHLGTFRLRVAPAGARARLDARAVALIPGEFVDIRTTRGNHDLHVEADGFPPLDRPIIVDAERAANVDVSLAAGRPAAQVPRGDVPGDGRHVAGWFVLGAGVVAAGVGTYAGVQAQSLANSYNTPGSGHFQDASTKASGLVFRTSADVTFAAALGLGVVGLYLLLSDGGAHRGARAGLVLGPVTGLAGSY